MEKKTIVTRISYRDNTGEMKTLILSRNEIMEVNGKCLTNTVLSKEELEELEKAFGKEIGAIFCCVENSGYVQNKVEHDTKIKNSCCTDKKISSEMEEFLLEIEAFKKKMQELEFTYKEVAELTKEFVKARVVELPKYCSFKVYSCNKDKSKFLNASNAHIT